MNRSTRIDPRVRSRNLAELQKQQRTRETDFTRMLALADKHGWKTHATRVKGFGLQDLTLERPNQLIRASFIGGQFSTGIAFADLSSGVRGVEATLDEVLEIVGSDK